ncbi:MAG: hypothetical protein OXB84_01655, partial [Halobacteriovoraceae bacterium]|nr:hypothetical protein [Halobacteriovoraceae bacterium]
GKYGDAFDQVYKEIDDLGIPVIINPKMRSKVLMYVNHPYTGAQDAMFMINVKGTGDVVDAHRIRNILNDEIFAEEFKRNLPKIADSVDEQLKAAARSSDAITDINAPEGSVQGALKGRGFKKVGIEQRNTFDADRGSESYAYDFSVMVKPKNPRHFILKRSFHGGYLYYEVKDDELLQVTYEE